ncbi:MAG: FAD-binding oxidoreductase [Alphaproteobacteria bacterium]|nr:FAD-binding oxidoreductase [Alphaproteobacteria bacterium]
MPQSIDAISYYQATASSTSHHPPLAGEVSADVCIVGAGYTGLSAALELAEAGFKVVVLEARTVGHGASGRNGGQICSGFSASQDKLESQLGRDDARKCFALSEDAKQLLRDRVARHRIDCDLRWGYIHAIPKPSQVDMLKAWKDEWDGLGYTDTTLLSKDALEERLGTRVYHGALREGGAGHFHPLNYCLGLARAAQEAGALIHEQSPVVHVETDGNPVARTATGSVRSKFMVIAGNAYLGRTVKPLYGKVMPVTSYIIATEPLGENRAKALIRDGEAVANTNFIVDYYRLTGDTRMLFGGRASYSTLEPSNLGAYMKPRMTAVFPQLRDARIDYAWGGYIAITYNRIPDCGRLGPSTYYAHGFSGHGVALSGLYGKLMADAIQGQAGSFDMLSRVRHLPFPGGAIRTPMLVAAMLFYRIKDALS